MKICNKTGDKLRIKLGDMGSVEPNVDTVIPNGDTVYYGDDRLSMVLEKVK